MSNNSLRAGTIFITGISVSGKSTLGKRLKEDLAKSGIDNVKLLDGEDIRSQLAKRGKHYGYSKEERKKVSLQMAHMALEYNREGIVCIICSICHMKELRKQMRAIIGDVMEVYLDCPVSICVQRDYKGQYAKAFQGLLDDFIGVSEPYQRSEHVESVLYTGSDSVEKCSSLLLESVMTFLKAEQVETRQYNGRKKFIRNHVTG